MSTFPVRLTDDETGKDYYLHWSTVTDGPIYVALSLEDYRDYFRKRYGLDRDRFVEQRGAWKRLEDVGLMWDHESETPTNIIEYNRAGLLGEELTAQGVVRVYCRDRLESGPCCLGHPASYLAE